MSSSGQTLNARWPVVLTALLALIAVVRIVSTYSHTAQAFDEPCHVAAAIELLDRHSYTLDPVIPCCPDCHRVAALPRWRALSETSSTDHNITYNDVGDAILYDSGHYLRNLKLARLGVLPFFLLGTAIVFLWARRECGDMAGVMAAALFTTLPNVLAFSSIAYTDIVVGGVDPGGSAVRICWLARQADRTFDAMAGFRGRAVPGV